MCLILNITLKNELIMGKCVRILLNCIMRYLDNCIQLEFLDFDFVHAFFVHKCNYGMSYLRTGFYFYYYPHNDLLR